MKLLDKIHSKEDKTIKYVLQLDDGLITENSFIDNGTDKDIICVGSQTACNMGCKFCHTTDASGKVKVRNLTNKEILHGVELVFDDLNLGKRLLLVSYMGCGEPLLNWDYVSMSMQDIKRNVKNCRFGIATMIPKSQWFNFFDLVREIQLYRLNVKMHLSLHFIDDGVRKDWMPKALEVGPSIAALEFYKQVTGNSVEVHYTLIDGINDTIADAEGLAEHLHGREIPVKLLKYNERAVVPHKAAPSYESFWLILQQRGIQVEYYDPPGRSIGASCGQFLLDYYLKYNTDPTGKQP